MDLLQVDDQMKLLQHAWSDLLILDHLHQRLHNHLPDDAPLPNGQKFDLLSLSLLGCPSLADPLHDLTARLTEIRFDVPDYVCLKFLMLLNPGNVILLFACGRVLPRRVHLCGEYRAMVALD